MGIEAAANQDEIAHLIGVLSVSFVLCPRCGIWRLRIGRCAMNMRGFPNPEPARHDHD